MPVLERPRLHHSNYFGSLPAVVSNCLIAAALIFMTSFSGCSSLPSSSQPESATFLGTPELQVRSFTELLKHIGTVPNERLVAELRYFLSHNVGTDIEKHKAAYVLARILQKQASTASLAPNGMNKSISPGAFKLPSQPTGSNNMLKTQPANSLLEEAISLFEEASKAAPLWERSQWHIVEAASVSGNENAVRKALDRLREKTKRNGYSVNPGVMGSSGTAANDEHSRGDATHRPGEQNSGNTKHSRDTGAPPAQADKLASIDYALAQSFVRTKENQQAKLLFETIRREAPGSQYATGSAYYLAQLELGAETSTPSNQESIEAITLYRSYLKASPDGRFAKDILESMTELAQQARYQPTADDRALFGRVYYVDHQWQNALNEWEQAPSASNHFRKAVCLANLGRQDDAVSMLLTGVKSQPESSFYSSAAEIVSRRLNRAKTLELWEQILSLHPSHADHALWNIAIRANEQRAKPLLQQLIRNYPTSEFAPESYWWLFWAERNQAKGNPQRLRSALTLVDYALKTYPGTKYAAKFAFWSGKINEQLKRPAEARISYAHAAREFGATYYGHRARYRLKVLGQSNQSTVKKPIANDRGWSINATKQEPDLDWSWPEIERFLNHERIEQLYGATIAELTKLHQYSECLELMPNNSKPELRAWLFAKLKQPLDAINAVNKRLVGHPESSARWQFAYPLLYTKEVAQNARVNKLDPLLVHALIREESRYNSEALSRSNAIGLMQLLKGTAYGVAKRIGLNLNGVDDIFVPSNNLKMGTGYLAYTLRRFDGNPLLAVASYNGGPGAVRAWYKKHKSTGSGDFDVFVENIPYRETRDYVKKVFGSYWTYELVYAQSHKHLISSNEY